MAKSRNPRPPVPRPPVPLDPPRDPSPSEDPCAQPRQVRVSAAPVPVGTPVDAIPEGGGVVLFAESQPLGNLSNEDAVALRTCASQGWAFSGYVTDYEAGHIVASLTGYRLT
jgi:hypothetical protein